MTCNPKNLSDKLVRFRIYKSLIAQEKSFRLKKLGIDEIALVKGQGNYCATLVDLEKSKVVDILPERSQEKMMSVLMS